MATGNNSDVERGTDETFDFLCTVCKGKNKNTEAVKFCSDCNDYYCSTCVKVHDDIPILKNHQILDKAQFQIGSSVTLLAVPTERCITHRHKPVDMYCKNHDVVACSACMLVQHSVCKDKFYVPDFINNSNNAPNSQDTEQQLKTIATVLDALQRALNTERDRLKSSKENSLKQIRKFRADINQSIDELEKSTVSELDKRYQSLLDKLESQLKELQVPTTEVKAAHDSVKSAGGNLPQLFVCVKTANVVARRAKEKADTIKSQVSPIEISFVANQKLKSLLNDIKFLGDITLTDKLLSQP